MRWLTESERLILYTPQLHKRGTASYSIVSELLRRKLFIDRGVNERGHRVYARAPIVGLIETAIRQQKI